jgi:adenylate kinase family enzyme
MNKHRIVIVTSDQPGSGKTTLAEFVADSLNVPHTTTSNIVTEYYCQDKDITPEEVIAARKINREAYRQELIDAGMEMQRQGMSQTTMAIRRGYVCIDGTRRFAELEDALSYMERHGMEKIHVHLVDSGATVKDSTEGEKLMEAADHIFDNTNKGPELFEFAKQVIISG